MKVRGHNLMWNHDNFLSGWPDGHFTTEKLHDLLHEHSIRKVVGHYRGKVFAWDVVNEAFQRDGELRDTIWYDRPGIGRRRKPNSVYRTSFLSWAL